MSQLTQAEQHNKFSAGLLAYTAALQTLVNKYWETSGLTYAPPPQVSVIMGKKFAKIVKGGEKHSTTVHTFVDIASGDIYAAAGWDKKAKHVRGSIYNENPTQGVHEHGAISLRNGGY